jgi:predicted phage terminase large subunit-like protein
VYVRAAGDPLWPAREGLGELATMKHRLGSAAYAAQYQQQPAPAGGTIFKREWFRYYNALPKVRDWVASWDMTFKNGSSNDWVVGLVGVRSDADLYIVDRAKGQWDFSQTCQHVEQLSRHDPQVRTILIEDTANGPAIINMLGRRLSGVVGVTPEGGKVARASAAQPFIEAGNLWLPNPLAHGRAQPDRAWVTDFVDECCAFPHAAHDDDVDALTQLIARVIDPKQQFVSCVW